MLNRRGRNFSYAGVFRTLNQEGKVVAVGSVSLKRFFVEQAFNAATEANLVGISLRTDWPAEFTMPAAPENHHGGGSNAGGHQA